MSNPSQQFLRLTPLNYEAQQAFNDAALGESKDPDFIDRLDYARNFMFVERCNHETLLESTTLYENSSVDDLSLASKSETETENEMDSSLLPPPLTYHGYHYLSFGKRPRVPLLGWTIGIGRWSDPRSDRPGNGRVELLLAPPGTPFSKYEVAGKHARLNFDQSGSLTLHVVSPRSPRIILGNETFSQGQRTLVESKTRVSFGKLEYSLEYVMEPEAHIQHLNHYFQNHLLKARPPPDIAASPTPWDLCLGKWLIRGTVGRGSFASVNAAKDRYTGLDVAAKCFIRDRTNQAAIAMEISLLRSLPSHPHILRFLDVMYERDDRWLMSPQDEQDERSQFPARPERVIIIYEPFARATFSELLLDQPIPLKMLAFAQLLQGIDALHSAGFIHRDIKLGNLGVVSISKTDLQIVILDYGQTIRASRCDPKPGAIGTVPYLAPEMEKSTYGHKVDIWASAIVGLQLFLTDGKPEWKNVVDEKARYMRRVQLLRGAPQDGIENLLAKMLAWDSLQRPTADDTLKHPCFRAVLDVINPQLGQKRRAPT